MIMGGVYLAYSAYFLSIDFAIVYTVMNIIMVLLYLGLLLTFAKGCIRNIKNIDENIMRDSLLIKRTMLKWILIGEVVFCFSKAFDYGVDNNLGD